MIKDIMRTVLVLSLIALIAGGLLGLVNTFTVVDEAEALAKKIDKTGIYSGTEPLEKLDLGGEGISPLYNKGSLKNVFKGGSQYVIHCSGEGGYGGSVELLVNIEDSKIVKIAMYAAEETPGLGSKAFKDSYLNQFYGKDVAEIEAFVFTKNNVSDDAEIKGVTGASKSSNAVINAVNVAVTWYLANVLAEVEG